MKPDPFDAPHDPRDPNPWLANYLDQSTPLDDAVKRAWLADSASGSRQYRACCPSSVRWHAPASC